MLVWAASLYSSQVASPCSHLTHASSLLLSFVRSSLFILAVLLPPLLFSPDCWDGPFLRSEEAVLENPLPLLDHASLQDCMPCKSSKQIPAQAKVCAPEVLAGGYCYLLYSPPFRLLNTTMVTAARAVPSLYIPNQFLLVCTNQVQGSISPHQLIT